MEPLAPCVVWSGTVGLQYFVFFGTREEGAIIVFDSVGNPIDSEGRH